MHSRALFGELTGKTGEEFFRALTRGLAELLPVRTCIVTRRFMEQGGRNRILAAWHGDRFLDGDDGYDLEGTPCREVLRGESRRIDRDLRELFPALSHAAAAGAQSYAGVPIENHRGEILGHLAVFDGEAFAEGQPDPLVLELFAARACGELERQRAEARLAEQRRRAEGELRSIVEGTAPTVGEAFFRSLVQHLASALGVKFAIVGEVTSPKPDTVRTLAVWAGDEFADNFEYTLDGAPCEDVVDRSVCFYPRNVQLRFPRDPLLVELGVESYLGVPLFGSDDQLLGLLVVMDDAPMEESPHAEYLLTIFAGRAGAELERLRGEEERRRLEAEVRQAQKLESLGTLAGSIAHDFNNLLVGILGNAELLKKYLPEGSRGVERLRALRTAADRASELANQMLTYSGKGELTTGPCDLNALIREICQLVRASIPKKCQLRFDLDGSLPAIEADATQIRQVVMNLTLNAADAIGDESGEITLRTGVVPGDGARGEATFMVPGETEPSYVFLSVTDTGCGMDEATLSRLFEPFFTTKPKGRGLGLAAILGILRSHGGGIQVESEPGRGTSFRAFLRPSDRPAAFRDAREEFPSAARGEGLGAVLVADDEETVRALAASALEESGFEVLVAEDGRQAIEIFRERADEIGAVLLDMNMPKLSGEQVLRELRGLRSDVPILLSSGYNQGEAAKRLESDGNAAFIQKPYRPGQLVRAVYTALKGRA